MTSFSRMPRYDIRNDGYGPYAIFYCDVCGREFRSRPDVGKAVTQDIGRSALGGLLRKVPLVGGAVADNVVGEDPRYSLKMDEKQLEAAWVQVQEHFRQCPTCDRIVCLSDFDTQSGFCNEDSPRQDEIAESRGSQAGAALKGFATALGLGGAVERATEAARKVQDATTAKCPNCNTIAEAGTKFCPECGTKMVQPSVSTCPKCGTETMGAKFCPNCGEKMENKPIVTHCPKCGTETKGAKFCPECGEKLA